MKNFLISLAALAAAVLLLYTAWQLDHRQTVVPETLLPVTVAPAETEPQPAETEPEETEPRERRLVFTFAGNCILGGHEENDYAPRGFRVTVGEDYGYPFRHVAQWFEKDDLTLVNLEGVLGDRGLPSENRYNFRGSGEYVKILTENSVEAVSLANNHIMDYGRLGYEETKRILGEAGVSYVEKNAATVVTLESGMTVGIYGTDYAHQDQKTVTAGIRALKEQGVDVIIYAAHWGKEHHFEPTLQQKELGRAAIDAGAHIVYGTHPHVLQPVEEYGDGVIFYSLGNFSFGGDMNPLDYDTALVRQEIVWSAGGGVSLGERRVVPCSVSSAEGWNNYQPVHYEEGTEEYDRVLSKLEGTYDGPRILHR